VVPPVPVAPPVPVVPPVPGPTVPPVPGRPVPPACPPPPPARPAPPPCPPPPVVPPVAPPLVPPAEPVVPTPQAPDDLSSPRKLTTLPYRLAFSRSCFWLVGPRLVSSLMSPAESL